MSKTGSQLDSWGIMQDWSTAHHLERQYSIGKDTENSGVIWEEALLMTDRKEWSSRIAQCARHGLD